MVLEGALKYATWCAALVVALFLGWYFSVSILNDIIRNSFQPRSEDSFNTTWFFIFALLEFIIVLVFAALFFKKNRSR